MTNLTEQWKKGKLPCGWYWVEGSRAEGIYAYTAEYLNNMYRPRNSERIVEQVPSYDEWQEKESQRINLMTKLNDVNNENHALEIEKNKLEQDFFAYQKMLNEANKDLNKYYFENTKLEKQINHLSKTQARQFVDNQKLQIKAKHAKDVVNIDTARQIKQLKELLKECRFLISEIPLIRKIDENDEMLRGRFLIYRKICEKIDQVLGE